MLSVLTQGIHTVHPSDIYTTNPLTTCKVKVKVTQSCLTLCNPMNYTVHEILQAKILE